MADTSTSSLSEYYDTVPYESHPFSQTAPEHLEALAYLFGLDSPPPAAARVLELGCAAGGNLIPIAARFPKAKVVGVDLSPVQINLGKQIVDHAGLKKQVDLRAFNIAEITKSFGKFDYIICHGVYSWVPPEIQEAILRVCSEHLSPNGLAYISYNVYPGWKSREIVRDAMILRGGSRSDPAEKLSYARGMLDFLEESARPDSVLKKALDETLPIVRNSSAYYLMHEFLEPVNAPCYFKDFVARAKEHGLAYFADVEPSSMFVENYGAKVREPLAQECGTSQELMEQYLDFLVNRCFRQTILVKDKRAAQIRYRLDAERIRGLEYAGVFEFEGGQPLSFDANPQNGMALGRVRVTLRQPVHKAVAQVLHERYPASISADGLIKEVSSLVGHPVAAVEPLVIAMLEELLIQGGVRIRRTPMDVPASIPELPRALEFVRTAPAIDLAAGPEARTTNQWHETVVLSVIERCLLPRLDGKTTHQQLAEHLAAEVRAGRLQILKDGQPVTDGKALVEAAREHVAGGLANLRRKALLVGR